jgi:hypothetical protein
MICHPKFTDLLINHGHLCPLAPPPLIPHSEAPNPHVGQGEGLNQSPVMRTGCRHVAFTQQPLMPPTGRNVAPTVTDEHVTWASPHRK